MNVFGNKNAACNIKQFSPNEPVFGGQFLIMDLFDVLQRAIDYQINGYVQVKWEVGALREIFNGDLLEKMLSGQGWIFLENGKITDALIDSENDGLSENASTAIQNLELILQVTYSMGSETPIYGTAHVYEAPDSKSEKRPLEIHHYELFMHMVRSEESASARLTSSLN